MTKRIPPDDNDDQDEVNDDDGDDRGDEEDPTADVQGDVKPGRGWITKLPTKQGGAENDHLDFGEFWRFPCFMSGSVHPSSSGHLTEPVGVKT